MKTIFKPLAVACLLLTLISCGQKQEPKEKYCGYEVSGFEVIDLKAAGDKGYTYTDEDKKLAADITAAINGLFDTNKDIKIGFILKTDAKIGLYILGPDDGESVEKISCYLLQNNFDGRLPEERRLLFYTETNQTIVAAIRNKKES